jgi:ABC-type polysaccharide/polyol phosphate export permease
LVQRYIYLNPTYSIVLMDTRNYSFFDYEYDVYGKWGYVRTDFILQSIGQVTFKNLEMWNCRLVYIYE